jgi:hypothetical protein
MAFRPGAYLAVITFSILVGAGYAVYSGALVVPERYDPWAPLDPLAEPDWLTGMKLGRASRDPLACNAALARTGLRYDPVPDRVTGPGCGFSNAVRLHGAPVRLGSPVTLTCPMALSFHMWERHALQPAAEARYGQRVAAVEHLGSYACRNINRGDGEVAGASRSRHATADALDIAALVLADGRRISLVRDWRPASTDADPATVSVPTAALLLRDAHRGACRYFDGVLGPDYNAAHRDHFHLEAGGYRMCR